MTASSPGDGWRGLVAGLSAAGDDIAKATAELEPTDRADAQLALVRALNNMLGRFETDRDSPELAPFNGWREKFFMDNPDYRYWIADIRDDRDYRITGNIGDSVYQSITVYAGRNIATTTAVARLDTDDLTIDSDGNFETPLGQLPQGSTSVWVRYVHDQTTPAQPGWCRIETRDQPTTAPPDDASRLDRDLSRLGAVLGQLPTLMNLSVAADIKVPNSVRHWTSMTGGAAFTEPGIHYLRGVWQLEPDEALVVEGPLAPCRHWNIVLYNRFLNSLDYRHRVISRSAATSTITDGRYRFVLAGRDPQADGYDWVDTAGRGFGLFVMRFLQPAAEPELPTVQRVPLAEFA